MIKQTAVLLSLFVLCGCAYTQNRISDAGDIFSVSCGYGLGASAQAGPIIAGLMGNKDVVGIRGGVPFANFDNTNAQITTTVLNVKEFYSFSPKDSVVKQRGKDLEAFGPLFTPNGSMSHHDVSTNPAHYTQLEVVVAAGPSIRLGFNPGELLDFILGFFGVDIFNDDIHGKDQISPVIKENGSN